MTKFKPDNKMLVLALKSISDCVCISDMDDIIIFVNDSFCYTYGYHYDELVGQSISILRSDNNDPNTLAGIFQNTLQGGWRGELLNRRKDGSVFPVNIATSVILDDEGLPMALMGIARDVSETKKMQARFRTVAALFQSLGADSVKNISTIVTCACEVIGGAASMYNRLDDRNCSLIVWAGHNLPNEMKQKDKPDGHICYEATIKGQNQPVVINDLSVTPYYLSDPNVSRFGLKSYLGAPVTCNGKTVGSLAIVDVVTRNFTPEEIDLIEILARALSQEEARQDAVMMLETAVNQSPSGILIAEAPDIKIRMANSKAKLLLTGKDDGNLNYGLHGNDRVWSTFDLDGHLIPVDQLPLTQAIVNGEVTENKELIIKSENGDEHYVSVNAAPIKNNDGAITAGVLVFHDITLKRQTEIELHESDERLRTLINAMPDIVCFKDGEGRWLEANESDVKLFELYGVPYKGKKDSELAMYSDFYREAFLNCESTDEIAWKRRGPVRTDETIPSPDGTSRVFDIIKVPTFDENGDRKALVVVGRDITERINTEKALKDKAIELERFNNLMIGRELKMIDLKREINELLLKLGQDKKYMIHEQ